MLLVDRARFPSEIPHGHFIHRHGPGRLSRWGLLDRVLATGCQAITSFVVDVGDFPLVVSYWSGVPGEALELHQREQRIIFAFPTNDGLYAVFVGWPTPELDTVRRDPEHALLAAVDQVPELAERVRGGHREERLLGATQLPNFLRRPGGPGWALVGDAGCHKDTYLALGVCDAFRDADLLAESIGSALSGSQPERDALAEYERRRNEATMPDFRRNLAEAELGPPSPELLAMRASLRGDQEAINRYMLVGEGLIEPDGPAG